MPHVEETGLHGGQAARKDPFHLLSSERRVTGVSLGQDEFRKIGDKYIKYVDKDTTG